MNPNKKKVVPKKSNKSRVAYSTKLRSSKFLDAVSSTFQGKINGAYEKYIENSNYNVNAKKPMMLIPPAHSMIGKSSFQMISNLGQTKYISPITNLGQQNMYFKIENPVNLIYEPSIKQAIYRRFANSNQKIAQPLVIKQREIHVGITYLSL